MVEGRSVSVHVDAPALAVWELVVDVTRMGEWSPETVSAEWLEEAKEPALGARFRGHNKRRMSWATTCTVIASEPGRTFAFDVGEGETRWAYTIDDETGGCRLTESVEIARQPGTLGRLLTRLGTGVPWHRRLDDLEAGMVRTIEAIKTAAESPGDAQPETATPETTPEPEPEPRSDTEPEAPETADDPDAATPEAPRRFS